MTAILDTGFLLAIANSRDRHHRRVMEVALTIEDDLVAPITILPEVTYLIGSRMGHEALRAFLRELVASQVLVESVNKADLQRSIEVLETYADSRLDFVDATVVAIAERLGVTRILTIDRRHFAIIRPRHCAYFELLP